MITLKNVTKYFGRVKAVNDVSFSVESGEVVGFLGPNGAGKTTTLRMITGFLAPDRGTITIDGIDIERDPVSAQKKIGYLPENNPLYKTMQAGEFLDLAARLHGIDPLKRGSATDRAVSLVGIEKVFYRPIGELSKGFRQRVGIAAALIHSPEIIVLDEPTEGLDPNQRDEIRRLVKELAKKQTVIMSTHVMQEASAVCGRLIIINKGRIAADGTARDLSKLSPEGRRLALDIEGDGVEAALRSLVGKDAVSIRNRKGNRIAFELLLEGDREFRPDISRLAWQNKWVLWGMHEEERKLEEVFRTLTSGKEEK